MPKRNVADILGDPLIITLSNGTELPPIRDIPLRVSMEIDRARQENRDPDPWLVLGGICEALGVTREQMEGWGTAEAIYIVDQITDHFLAVVQRLRPTPEPGGPSTGPTPS